MSLKKNLKTGQAVIEYLIIFAAIGALVIITASPFLDQVKSGASEMYRTAIARMR